MIYLDNAATSYPKPESVYAAVQHAISEVGATPGRGAHRLAREALAIVSGAREKVALLLDIPDPELVVFTKNATESINVALKGWLRPGDCVLVSGMEHNAVVRPLERLKNAGIDVKKIPCTHRGSIRLDVLQHFLASSPRLMVLIHASNVNGALQPVAQVARMCDERQVPLLLDAAQTAGIQAVSAAKWNLGMLACSGHKALLGPPGLGILYIRPDLNVFPLMEGGTGSRSEDSAQPEYCPDRYESGTPNLPGIAGLSAGINFILEEGIDAIRTHELELAFMLERELAGLPGVTVYPPEVRGTGTVAFNVNGMNPGDVGFILDDVFGIAVRTGLHCAPLAHETLGTFPDGTVRVSPGYSTTEADVRYLIRSLRTLTSRR